jgi:hypothetical protein
MTRSKPVTLRTRGLDHTEPQAIVGLGPARGLWTNLGRLPLGVFSIGKYAFQKKRLSDWGTLQVRRT